ncbi:PREDICTED: snaclec coagulation factor IX-binding protein subunit A-like [Acropora digitifera]|uniref:snaclec coagulation factor IX-binding protein subunit A-like n=1 Tax=Acropora digitifera TaxID=70779 RepID=UPI00077A64BB|nr:PREDICTED: snaclec coagulation factor IX-binding protein subunit A-like [Acropora digitifera]
MKSLIITSIAGVLALVSSVTGSPTELKRSYDVAGIPINQCDQGWVPFNSFCYLVSASVKTRSDAQKFCKASGAELVKITSQSENDFVLALAREKAPSVKQVWIGLQYESRPKKFYWSDGSFPVYKNWAPNEPNGNAREPCAHMWTGQTPVIHITSSGYWNDLPCSINHYYPNGLVCKKLASH